VRNFFGHREQATTPALNKEPLIAGTLSLITFSVFPPHSNIEAGWVVVAYLPGIKGFLSAFIRGEMISS
jgi:hypothetical protein